MTTLLQHLLNTPCQLIAWSVWPGIRWSVSSEHTSILNYLSLAADCKLLSDAAFIDNDHRHISRRIENVFEFMNNNFHKRIMLRDAARVANMAQVSFSRFIKHHTGNSFVSNLNEIRLGNVTRLLIHTSHSSAEIAYKCGFNNLANFYRLFKNRKGLTPKEFRNSYFGSYVLINN